MATTYATVTDVANGFRTLDSDEQEQAFYLLEEAATIIDAYAVGADDDAKKLVSCRMVRRAINSGNAELTPMGTTQGSASALGYTQSWTFGSGSAGELYLSKLEKKMLGIGNRIGSYSPVEELVDDD